MTKTTNSTTRWPDWLTTPFSAVLGWKSFWKHLPRWNFSKTLSVHHCVKGLKCSEGSPGTASSLLPVRNVVYGTKMTNSANLRPAMLSTPFSVFLTMFFKKQRRSESLGSKHEVELKPWELEFRRTDEKMVRIHLLQESLILKVLRCRGDGNKLNGGSALLE